MAATVSGTTPVCSMSDAIAYAANLEFVTTLNGTESAPRGIEYCLSQQVPEVCKVGFTVYIMLIVVICNLLKVATMIASFWVLDDTPLVTIGDALSSFLEKPDETTKDRCLMEARSSITKPDLNGEKWNPKRHRWFYAPKPFSVFKCLVWYVKIWYKGWPIN